MKFITYIIAALMLLSVPALAAGAEQERAPLAHMQPESFIALNPSVTVNAGVVRLGDLFSGADKYADRVVAYAPRPGGRAVYDARWLMRVAAAYKLNWRPGSNVERVVVERASQVITKREIEELLQQRHVENGGDPSSRALVSNRTVRLHLPIDETNLGAQALGVEQMSVDASSGRFTAVMAWGNGADERIRLAGRVERMTQVPMLADRVMRGEVIGEADIVWQSLPEARLSRTSVTDASQIIGMAAKRSLAPGAPIAASDLRRPLLVNRGETVTMTLHTPMMQLTAKGRALQHGSQGDIIRISNLQTNTVIDAVVTGPGRARVETTVNLAMR